MLFIGLPQNPNMCPCHLADEKTFYGESPGKGPMCFHQPSQTRPPSAYTAQETSRNPLLTLGDTQTTNVMLAK